MLGALSQSRRSLVEHAALDEAGADAEKRNTAWVECNEAMDAQLAEEARAVGESSKA